MGTVLRALGRGWQPCVVQFVKSGSWHSGEVTMLRQLGTSWHTIGDGFSWDSKDLEQSAELGRRAFEVAREAIASGRFQLVVLDEVTYPINWGWLDVADVVATIRDRPAKVNVFLTGRNAPAALVELADTVTEMRNLKHAFDAGIRAARGIDF